MHKVLIRLGLKRGLSIKVDGGKGSGVIASAQRREQAQFIFIFEKTLCSEARWEFFILSVPRDNGSCFRLIPVFDLAGRAARSGSCSQVNAGRPPLEGGAIIKHLRGTT